MFGKLFSKSDKKQKIKGKNETNVEKKNETIEKKLAKNETNWDDSINEVKQPNNSVKIESSAKNTKKNHNTADRRVNKHLTYDTRVSKYAFNEDPSFDSNIHLKSGNTNSFAVNTQALDVQMFNTRFDMIKDFKERNLHDPRYKNKTKFNWQINEFE